MLLPESAAALACESFRTACEHEIALDSAPMGASGDTRAFSGWAAEFRRQLAAHGWTCPSLFSRELAGCLSSVRLPRQVFAFLTESTPAQRGFLEALARSGVQVTIGEESEDASGAAAMRYEFDWCCR